MGRKPILFLHYRVNFKLKSILHKPQSTYRGRIEMGGFHLRFSEPNVMSKANFF